MNGHLELPRCPYCRQRANSHFQAKTSDLWFYSCARGHSWSLGAFDVLTEPHGEPARGAQAAQAPSGASREGPEAAEGKSPISDQGVGGRAADCTKVPAAENDPT